MSPPEAKHLIAEIRKTKISAWERDFIASVSIQANQGRYLTSPQAKKLEQIYRDVSGKL